MKKLIGCLLLGVITNLLSGTQAWAQKNEELAREMRDAVTTFLKVLNPEQRQEAELPYADLARFDWNFTPRARKGITFKTLTPAQRKVAMAMVRVVLSQEGYSKAEQIIDLEKRIAGGGIPPPPTTLTAILKIMHSSCSARRVTIPGAGAWRGTTYRCISRRSITRLPSRPAFSAATRAR